MSVPNHVVSTSLYRVQITLRQLPARNNHILDLNITNFTFYSQKRVGVVCVEWMQCKTLEHGWMLYKTA